MKKTITIYKREYIKQPNETPEQSACHAYNHDPEKEVYFNNLNGLGDQIYTCTGCGKQTRVTVTVEERMPC